MTDDSTMMFNSNDGKRTIYIDNVKASTPSPNPTAKKKQRPGSETEKAGSLVEVLEEIDNNKGKTVSNSKMPEKQLDESDRLDAVIDSTTANISAHTDANTNKHNNSLNEKTSKTTEKMNNNNKNSNNKNANTQLAKLDNPSAKSEADETDPNEDADPMDKDIFCLDFTHGFKKPTDNWKELPDAIKKRRVIFDQTDESNILELIQDAPALFKMENAKLPLSVDAWNRIFQSTSNLISKKNPKRKYKDFGITLAGTHPQDVLPPEECFDSKFLESPIACALGGAYNYYGCIWVDDSDTVIDWKEEQILPTELWQLSPIKHRNLAKAFTDDEIFNESPSSLHCIEASMAVKMKIKDRDDPEEWKAKIHKVIHSTGQVHLGHGTIKDALMRIAKTHPLVFGQDQIVNKSKLICSSMMAL
jgi:hypothetical protein